MTVDTVVPTSVFTPPAPTGIDYVGNAFGWSIGGTHQWNYPITLVPPLYGGYFNPTPLFNCTNWYSPSSITSGSVDVVKLTVTDQCDGATATPTYTVKFHDRYDSPHGPTQPDVTRPRPQPTYPDDWQTALHYVNPSSSQVNAPGFEVQNETGWELSLGLEVKVPKVLGEIFNVTVGDKMSNKTSKKVTLPGINVAARTELFYYATNAVTKNGTCSQWGVTGYQSDTPYVGTTYSGYAVWGPVTKPLLP